MVKTLPQPIKLLRAEDIIDMLQGEVSREWVRLNVPGKVKLGRRTMLWRERDVQKWLASL